MDYLVYPTATSCQPENQIIVPPILICRYKRISTIFCRLPFQPYTERRMADLPLEAKQSTKRIDQATG